MREVLSPVPRDTVAVKNAVGRGEPSPSLGALVRGRHADTGDIRSPSRSTSAARAGPARRRWASRPPTTSRAWPSERVAAGVRRRTRGRGPRLSVTSRARGLGLDRGGHLHECRAAVGTRAAPASGDSMATVSTAALVGRRFLRRPTLDVPQVTSQPTSTRVPFATGRWEPLCRRGGTSCGAARRCCSSTCHRPTRRKVGGWPTTP